MFTLALRNQPKVFTADQIPEEVKRDLGFK